MVIDHSLSISAPADAYAFKHALYTRLSKAGVNVEGRPFLYGRSPTSDMVIVRTDDPMIISITAGYELVPEPHEGQEYDFALRASPMQSTPFGIQPTDPQKWLSKRLDSIGIALIASYHRTSWVWCSKPTKPGVSGFYLPDVVYLGRLLVTDAVKVTHVLTYGVGRHRAFGFGLLQLYEG